MKYICVRTYGNGRYMNKVYNLWFEWLSQAERMCDELNKIDADTDEAVYILYANGMWRRKEK